MSPSAARRNDDERNLEWVHIDDFTPGLYDNSYISLATPQLSAPLGSGDAELSFCCAALGPSLGLGPLPALTHAEPFPSGLPGTSTRAVVIGLAVNPGLNDVRDELILIVAADDGVNHYQQGFSDVPSIALNQIFSLTTASGAGIFGAPYPSWTRMNADGSGNPPPTLVFPLSDDSTQPQGHLYIYPPVAAPTSFAVQDLIIGGSSVTGQVITYGNRVLVLAAAEYPWPAGGGIGMNENINFTDPPQSDQYGDQLTILGAEIPWGYGAWGTISVGELFLIKKNGGGVIMYGDIDSPSSVIPMPGVQSVGDFVGKASAGPLGLVYCSEQRGAWTWNGGDTSQKISRQLRDDFYDVGIFIGSNNYGFDVAHWQDWILFSNNYLYNADTNSWWVLYPNDANGTSDVPGHTFWWWNEGRFGNQMYAAPLIFGPPPLSMNWWYLFDSKVPAPHWQWASLPIEVITNGDRVLDVRQIILELSDPSNSGTATATVSVNGTDIGTTDRVIGPHPTPFRFNVGTGGRGIEHIDVQVNGDQPSSGSSPILHSIDIGYQPRAGIPVSN